MRTIAVILLSLAAAITTAAEPLSTLEAKANGSNEKHLLRYHFQKGSVMQWDVQQTMRVQTIISGVEVVSETISRSTKTWTVEEVKPDGTATFVYQVSDVDMSQKQSDRDDVSYNSKTDKLVPPTFGRIANSIGVPLARISINQFGETVKKLQLRPYDASAEENKIAIPLPKEPVAKGDSWIFPCPIEVPQKNGTVKKISARQRFTLKEVQTGVATIGFETQVLTPISDPEMELKLINSYPTGTLKFDIDKGQTIQQETIIDRAVHNFKGTGSKVHHLTKLTEQRKK
ncbi:MAG: hypothetical protein LBU65_09700 [Planctomycetaceae bacterium]|jgi:hypothetical protein|nr:hypothetical protein [Planctomycetaceae bacterium]